MGKRQLSFRWEKDVIKQADELAKKRGLTRSALIQLIIRERAAGEGVL